MTAAMRGRADHHVLPIRSLAHCRWPSDKVRADLPQQGPARPAAHALPWVAARLRCGDGYPHLWPLGVLAGVRPGRRVARTRDTAYRLPVRAGSRRSRDAERLPRCDPPTWRWWLAGLEQLELCPVLPGVAVVWLRASGAARVA